ncbi:acyltransferase family protein [Lutibacter maritimus]|uniref:Surface polysaccharide O-acyltransferase, integral membrane enzyme n=1 Tax=Lutibacter maritimus TaxID=593133 RepID=A0A1I6NQS2_9FLAO|nr:acyltransferase family protein [Lutibacter maritimus]SFS30298.1 Surface polysaccharide O-acyltransferase, integral membrane enzyme [Lutibacter maritimus]
MTTERRYDIDWLRVIAIGLLLIYHIAIIFQPWAMFIGFMRNDESLESLWVPLTMLNVWRIPLLFYVSGMGLYFAMKKRNWSQLIVERTKRILLPFVFGILVVTPLHFLIFQKYYNMALSYFPHMGHLWFLGNIFAYVILLSPLLFYLKRHENGKFKKVLSKIMTYAIGPLSVSVFFMLELVLVKPQLFELYAQTWHGFFIGLLAFFFGYLVVYTGKTFWQTVSKWKWLYITIAAVLFTLRLKGFDVTSIYYLKAIESNCWIFGVFGLGYRYLNKPSSLLSYLSQAAYPVYIIHMFVLYAGALFILPLQIHPMLKFIAITLFAFVACYFIYEFILRRVNILRPLFGLKWKFNTEKKASEISKPVELN